MLSPPYIYTGKEGMNMKKLRMVLTIGFLSIVLSACATIMRDNSQTVPITASTDSVDIKIADKSGKVIFEGQTPASVNLKTAAGGYFDPQEYTITASKDGFKNQTAIIDWHVSAWYWAGNVAFGGIVGYLLIDPITGDMYYLDENVHLNMTPVKK